MFFFLAFQKVKNMHVNLVDVVEAGGNASTVKRFGSVAGLNEYTLNTGKVFPKGWAEAGGMLRYLLREIENPPREGQTREAQVKSYSRMRMRCRYKPLKPYTLH